jgi:hypothetical protein
MTVADLINRLNQMNPNAVVEIAWDGFQSELTLGQIVKDGEVVVIVADEVA